MKKFTLIELLVVIVIVGILGAMIASAIVEHKEGGQSNPSSNVYDKCRNPS